MDYIIYLLLTAVLLVRPEEMIADLAGTRLYLWLILAGLIVAGGKIMALLSRDELERQPVTVCIITVWVVVVVSSFARGNPSKAWDDGTEFGKVILFYLYTVAVLDTVPRFQLFIRAYVVFTAIVATLGLLNYFKAVVIPGIEAIEHPYFDPATGTTTVYYRMVSSGIFNDPNDLCLILNAATIAALYLALNPGEGLFRPVWGGLIGLFLYALVMTFSRGGLLGLIVGVTAFLATRYGQTRGALIAGSLIPFALAVVGGRQGNISASSGNDRIQLWSNGLSLVPRYPVFGHGMNEYAGEVGLTAHNSFVNSYMELGMVGGSAFALAAFLCVYAPWTERLGAEYDLWTDFELARFRPYLVGMVASYLAGMFSLSRAYVAPTYLLFGFAVAFLNLTRTARLDSWYRVDRPMFGRYALVGFGCYLFHKLFVQTFAQW